VSWSGGRPDPSIRSDRKRKTSRREVKRDITATAEEGGGRGDWSKPTPRKVTINGNFGHCGYSRKCYKRGGREIAWKIEMLNLGKGASKKVSF